MAKNIVIVESPAKSKIIGKYLGKDFKVTASVGHIRDLPRKKFAVDIDDNFKPTYEVMDDKKRTVEFLKRLAKDADTVYLASDPDREGEAISWHLEFLLEKECKNIVRIEFNEINKRSVNEAIKNPHKINQNKVNAQQARRLLDRIVGYKISPLLWDRVMGGLSAGRVQSIVVKIIIDKENEIENFDAKEYWTITAKLKTLKNSTEFESKLTYVEKNNKREKFEVKDKRQAKEILSSIKNQTFRVIDYEGKPKINKPFPPFTTSILQQEASKKLNFNTKKTMDIAQQLYQGVSLGEKGDMGLITYMRTDSTRISDEFQSKTLSYIKDKYGADYSPKVSQKYATKGEAQDAHEAIRPTSLSNAPENIKQYITKDQYLLYQLIWNRFISSQMTNAVYDTVRVEVRVLDYIFISTGRTLTFDGYLKIYNETNEEKNSSNNEGKIIPKLAKEPLLLTGLKDKQNFTKPPSPFTEASLVKELEKKGVGRPATYASIISSIQKKGKEYVEKKGKKFVSTKLGREVNNFLERYFPEIMQVDFTKQMEEKLDDVEMGRKDYLEVLKDFYSVFEPELSSALKNASVVNTTGLICDKCGKPMVKRKGKYGEYLSCSGYPDCKNIKSLNKSSNVEETDKICPECSRKLVIKKSKTGSKFYSCSDYPTCQYIAPHESLISDKKCPKCNNFLVKKSYKKGKSLKHFWSCMGYPKCEYTEFYVDKKSETGEKCPKCSGTLIIRSYKDKNTKKIKKFKGCSNYPTCKHTDVYKK